MIYLYSGTPGSGKSLHLGKEILWYLNRKKEYCVICNFEVNLEFVKHPHRFHYLSNAELFPDRVREIASDFFVSNGIPLQEGRVILVIDECQLIFNSRTWNTKGRMDWLSFFSQHRKFGVNVYLVAQFDLMIDKQIRSLIEYEVVHRKISNAGNLGFVLRLLMFGDLFIGIERWYSLNQKVGQTLFRCRKKYYRLYDTFNTFKQTDTVADV